MRQPFNLRQQRQLAALCDTWVPSVRPPAGQEGDPTGYWGRTASDVGVPAMLADALARRFEDDELDEVAALLDLLARARFASWPVGVRAAAVTGMARANPDARAGLEGLRALTLMYHHGSVGEDGRNPGWSLTGRPASPPTTSRDPAPATWAPDPGDGEVVLEADVVVVGSGSGGGVVAGELAIAGLDVVVLEQGGAHADDEFPASELPALEELYWRGGMVPSRDGTIAILAGATLGGGSTINWQNCVPPPDSVRAEWAAHGLDDVATGAFDEHLDAVLARIGATRGCETNRPNEALAAGARALGWSWHETMRNVDRGRDEPVSAGCVGYGDRSGAKLGTLKTWLPDVVAAGGRIVVGCTVERVLVHREAAPGRARAVGVAGVVRDREGVQRPIRVHARHVVVAAGALETPAVLLRSRIGGPAAGRNLRLHPVPAMFAFHDEPVDPWWGAPQSVVVDEHRAVVDGHGYLLECVHELPGTIAASLPFRDARDHKLMMGREDRMTGVIAVQRDHGGGTVTLDDRGRAVIDYPMDDPVDLAVMRHALDSVARVLVASGARAVVDLLPSRPLWRRGDDLDAFIRAAQAAPVGPGGRVMLCAHQMGSARMGSDPATSVATPDGRLHDLDNVWIGDTSAFPTAVGSNPMVTCMALARRTAGRILAAD